MHALNNLVSLRTVLRTRRLVHRISMRFAGSEFIECVADCFTGSYPIVAPKAPKLSLLTLTTLMSLGCIVAYNVGAMVFAYFYVQQQSWWVVSSNPGELWSVPLVQQLTWTSIWWVLHVRYTGLLAQSWWITRWIYRWLLLKAWNKLQFYVTSFGESSIKHLHQVFQAIVAYLFTGSYHKVIHAPAAVNQFWEGSESRKSQIIIVDV